ncbi:unnamed protein product, partial [Effrenium voratum]
ADRVPHMLQRRSSDVDDTGKKVCPALPIEHCHVHGIGYLFLPTRCGHKRSNATLMDKNSPQDIASQAIYRGEKATHGQQAGVSQSIRLPFAGNNVQASFYFNQEDEEDYTRCCQHMWTMCDAAKKCEMDSAWAW